MVIGQPCLRQAGRLLIADNKTRKFGKSKLELAKWHLGVVTLALKWLLKMWSNVIACACVALVMSAAMLD